MEKKIITVAVLLLLSSLASAEVVCSRDYGGRLVIGECWYKKDNQFYRLTDLSDFDWHGGLSGGYDLNVTDTDRPFRVRIKPWAKHAVTGLWYDAQDIKDQYPEAELSHYIVRNDNYKFGPQFNVPQALADNIELMAFTLEESEGITWADVEILSGYRVRLNDVVLSYADLLGEGYTLTLYNKTTLLIGNVTGRAELFLDPTLSLDGDDVQDSYGSGYNKDKNYGTSTYESVTGYLNESYIVRFDISALPVGATINEALLEQYVYEGYHEAEDHINLTTALVYNIFEIDGVEWIEGDNSDPAGAGMYNYDEMPEISEMDLENVSTRIHNDTHAPCTAFCYYNVTVTDMLQYAVNLGYDDNVTFIKFVSERKGDNGGSESPRLYASENSPANIKLHIDYETGATTTTTTLMPGITNPSVNQTVALQGEPVIISADATQTDITLDDFWFTYNDTLGNISAAIDGTNNLLWFTDAPLLGNYSIEIYVNDTDDNTNVTSEVWVNIFTTTSTTVEATTTTAPPTTSTTLPSNLPYLIDFYVADINTLDPINAASITVEGNESQPITVNLTGSDGIAVIYINESLTYYTITYEKLGYHTQSENRTFTQSGEQVLKYMYPISDNGIIRLRITDLLFHQDREYCIYYKENDRLEGCYLQNETAQILVNREYYIIPEVTETDIISSSDNLLRNNSLYSGFIPSMIAFLAVSGILITLFISNVRRKRR